MNSGWVALILGSSVLGAACGIDQTTQLETDAGVELGGAAGSGGSGGRVWPDGGGGTAGVPPTGGGAGGTAGQSGGGTGGSTVDGSAGTTGWSPKDIAGCLLWLDADDSTVFDAPSGNVQTWEDKCSAHDATGGGNQRPKLVLQALNGRTGVSFDGVDDSLDIGGAAMVTGNFTLFVIVRTLVATGQPPVWSNRGIAGTGAAPTFFGTYNGKAMVWQNTSTPTGLYAAIQVPLQAMTYELSVGPAGRSVLVDGVVVASDTATGTATSVPNGRIGWDEPNDTHHAMDVFEMIGYSPALSVTDAQTVRTYLSAKWAVP